MLATGEVEASASWWLSVFVGGAAPEASSVFVLFFFVLLRRPVPAVSILVHTVERIKIMTEGILYDKQSDSSQG